MANSLKRTVSGHDSDKVLYYYRLPLHWATTAKWQPLGLNGATSTTNTRTLGTTQTKVANIKGVGSINQQRVVNVILTDPQQDTTDVARDLYKTWEDGDWIEIARVDWNTVRGTKGSRVVNFEYSRCYIANLPETESLGANTTENVTFEVNGVARRYDDNGNPFTLSESDFESGQFDLVSKFYNVGGVGKTGTSNGAFVDNSTDDSATGDATDTKPFDDSQLTPSGSTTTSSTSTAVGK